MTEAASPKAGDRKAPKMGGKNDNGVWCGGEPTDNNWLKSKRTRPVSDYCYRNGTDFRQAQARLKGLDEKLGLPNENNTGISLHDFGKQVENHLVFHGMDSVFYFPDKDDKMVNIISGHPIFTVDDILSSIELYSTPLDKKDPTKEDSEMDPDSTSYDSYDMDNLTYSAQFLLASIDAELYKQISVHLTADSTGPEVWIRITNKIHSSSVYRLHTVAEQARTLKLTDFTGENIHLYSAKMMQLCRTMEYGCELPKSICVTIIDQLVACSVEEFRAEFLSYRHQIINEVREYLGKSDQAIEKLISTKGYFTYQSLLSRAESAYQTLLDQDKWTSKQSTKDKGAAPEKLMNAAEVNSLVQKKLAEAKRKQNNRNNGTSGRGGGRGTPNSQHSQHRCFYCKETGHVRDNCPKLKNKNQNSNNNYGSNNNHNNNNNNRSNNQNSNSGNNNNGNGGNNNWNKVPPRNGESNTKTVNGRTFYWCGRCARWTLSHTTANHNSNGSVNNAGTNTGSRGNGNSSGNSSGTDNNANPQGNMASGRSNDGLYCNWIESADPWLDSDAPNSETWCCEIDESDLHVGTTPSSSWFSLWYLIASSVLQYCVICGLMSVVALAQLIYFFPSVCWRKNVNTFGPPFPQHGPLYVTEYTWDGYWFFPDRPYHAPHRLIPWTGSPLNHWERDDYCQLWATRFFQLYLTLFERDMWWRTWCYFKDCCYFPFDILFRFLFVTVHVLWFIVINVPSIRFHWFRSTLKKRRNFRRRRKCRYPTTHMLGPIRAYPKRLMLLSHLQYNARVVYDFLGCKWNRYDLVGFIQAVLRELQQFYVRNFKKLPIIPNEQHHATTVRLNKVNPKRTYPPPLLHAVKRQVFVPEQDVTAYARYAAEEMNIELEKVMSFVTAESHQYPPRWAVDLPLPETIQETTGDLWIEWYDDEVNASIEETVATMFTSPKASGKVPILWDTGATRGITPYLSDFTHPLVDMKQKGQVLKGLAAGLAIEGKGNVSYIVQAEDGTEMTLSCDTYYVPGAKRRIFSPQCYFQTREGLRSHAVQDNHGIAFVHNDKKIRIDITGDTNLTVFYAKIPGIPPDLKSHQIKEVTNAQPILETSTCHICNGELQVESNPSNANLSIAQKCLLRWHFKLGHFNFNSIQHVMRTKILGDSPEIKAASKCPHVRCASCLYGKARRRPTGTQTEIVVPPRSIMTGDMRPGQRVSVDHFDVTQPGRLFESRGRTRHDLQYHGGTIFYDHGSGYIYTSLQVHKNAAETIIGKQKFEKTLFDHGIIVQSYHTDNGVFSARDFIEEIRQHNQSIRFSGVGGHHQNGGAERAIGTIFSIARTILIHAAIRWADMVETTLWPMAVQYAVWLYNHMPRQSGLAPMELLTRSKNPLHVLNNCHVWGCPVYVLDPRMQTGNQIPRFDPRSRRGMFVGFSPHHSSNVPLVLNLQTLSITPQFHVVFDDWFSTVESKALDNPADPIWTDLFTEERFRYTFDDDDPVQLHPDWQDTRIFEEYRSAERENQRERLLQRESLLPPPPPQPAPTAVQPLTVPANVPPLPPVASPLPPAAPATPRFSPAPVPTTPQAPPSTPRPSRTPTVATPPSVPTPLRPSQPTSQIPISSTPLRRSTREHRPPQRYGYDGSGSHGYSLVPSVEIYESYVESISALVFTITDTSSYVLSHFHDYDQFGSYTLEFADPILYSTMISKKKRSLSDPLKYHEAILEPDWEHFLEAALKEIRTLEKLGTWVEIPRSDVPNGFRVLGGTWVFKRKLGPDGQIIKYKARYCVRGDQQIEGVDYFETYAPVTSWSTVRLLLILSIVGKLATVQVDYTNAFAQAYLKEQVYIEIPKGFSQDGNIVLKLVKSLYGLVQAPRTFYEYLTDNLSKRGFVCDTTMDSCLWINKKLGILCVIWVDDCLFFADDKSKIDRFIQDMQNTMPLTVEESVTTFLGIDVKHKDNAIYLTQEKLIRRIIDATDMKDCNAAQTPATEKPLSTDRDGEPFDEKWEYASVVGMLMFLANNTRPDIAFATHQCARFTHSPRKSHALAIKRIIRYLQGTATDGMILKPSNDFTVDCYTDSDFAGLYGYEANDDPTCVKSRTGYVLMIANCPLLWVSKLQTEIAASTMEAEYVALSQSMRDLIPMRRLCKLACDTIFGPNNYESKMYSSTFEDNNGALTLANSPRMTPRSKHYCIKYHWFKEKVVQGAVKLFKIASENNLADIFTKGLVVEKFRHLRKLLMGW